MTITFEIGSFFNDSSNDALVDELRRSTNQESMWEFEKKFNSTNKKSLHIHICRLLKHRQISRSLAAKWLIVILNGKEAQINLLKNQPR